MANTHGGYALDTTADRRVAVMQSEEDVLSRYSWACGDCFRCARRAVPTALVDELTVRSGERHGLRACRRCVLLIEQERSREAERTLRRQCGACALEDEDPL